MDKKEVNTLIGALDDSKTVQESESLRIVDPLEELKINLFDFFKKRLKDIEHKEAFHKKVQAKIEEILQEGELTFEQLMQLSRLYQNQSHDDADSIIQLFKPVPGASSPLIDNISKEEEKKDDIQQFFDNLNSEQLQEMDSFYRLMKQVMDNQKGK